MDKSLKRKLNQRAFVRRIIALFALATPCVCLYLLFSGFVPFWGRNMNVVAAFNGIFEILTFGRRSILFSLSSTVFSALYITAAVKMFLSIISTLKDTKKILIQNLDDPQSRQATKLAVFNANFSIWWLFFLYVGSHMMYAAPLRGNSLLIVTALVIFHVILNAAKYLLYYEKAARCIIKAMNGGLLLASIMLFAFLGNNMQIDQIFHGISILTFGSKFLAQTIIQQILVPAFNIVTVFSLIHLYSESNRADFYVYDYYEKKAAKGLLIRNAIFLCVSILCFGLISRYTDFVAYLQLAYQHIIFVLVTALIGVVAWNDLQLRDVAFIEIEKDPSEEEAEEEE